MSTLKNTSKRQICKTISKLKCASYGILHVYFVRIICQKNLLTTLSVQHMETLSTLKDIEGGCAKYMSMLKYVAYRIQERYRRWMCKVYVDVKVCGIPNTGTI